MGGGGGTPAPTREEKLLAQMASDKYDMAKGLTAGGDYLTKDATVDRTARYTEKALGDTARLLGQNQIENPENPVTGPVDLTANVAATIAGKTQADLDTQAKQVGIAQNTLGNVSDTTAAVHQEGLRKQALEQAESDYKNASKAATVNAVTSIGTAYAMNRKAVNKWIGGPFEKDAAPQASRRFCRYRTRVGAGWRFPARRRCQRCPAHYLCRACGRSLCLTPCRRS